MLAIPGDCYFASANRPKRELGCLFGYGAR